MMLAFEGSKHNVIISINHLQNYWAAFKSRRYSESYRNNIDASLKVLGMVSNENFRNRPSLHLNVGWESYSLIHSWQPLNL